MSSTCSLDGCRPPPPETPGSGRWCPRSNPAPRCLVAFSAGPPSPQRAYTARCAYGAPSPPPAFTGRKVPRPTWRVTKASLIPFCRILSSSSRVKCSPAVGAAARDRSTPSGSAPGLELLLNIRRQRHLPRRSVSGKFLIMKLLHPVSVLLHLGHRGGEAPSRSSPPGPAHQALPGSASQIRNSQRPPQPRLCDRWQKAGRQHQESFITRQSPDSNSR